MHAVRKNLIEEKLDLFHELFLVVVGALDHGLGAVAQARNRLIDAVVERLERLLGLGLLGRGLPGAALLGPPLLELRGLFVPSNGLLRQIRDEASFPLEEIALEPKNLLELRLVALRSLEQLHEADPSALFETYQRLLLTDEAEIRKCALRGLVHARKGPLAQIIADAGSTEGFGVKYHFTSNWPMILSKSSVDPLLSE